VRYFRINILFILVALSLFAFCKKEKDPKPPPPPSNAVTCNASNLIVDSILEITGQSKLYQLTVTDYTFTASSGSYAAIRQVEQVSMDIVGDTFVNSIQGKRYRITSTHGWDFRAYSYKHPTDSLWRLVPIYISNGGEMFFTAALKLPLVTGQLYTYSEGFETHNCTVDTSICKLINFIHQPVYRLYDYIPATTPFYINMMYVNKTGLIEWAYTGYYIQTQNTDQHATEWHFEKIN
jgi:hypothetical protein